MTANHAHTPKALSTEFVRDMFEIAAVYTGHSESMEAATPHFNRWHSAEIAAAEQRGAEAALMCENEISMEHHEQTDDFPCTRCLTRAQEMIDEYRADQMEGDDD